MKRRFFVICAVAVTVVLSALLFAGCAGEGEQDTEPKEYTVQYTDDSGVHTIAVTDGMPYSLNVIPARTGYDFIGLFDAEDGGMQHVLPSGSSLTPFSAGRSLVLFPQYRAKQYTLILDYQGAPVIGQRQMTATYDSSLPELPNHLTGDHKTFTGWYTKANCGGKQVADVYGLIPIVSVFNAQNFDISGSTVTLYAGFEPEKHTVTFCFDAGMDTENMQVAYGTPIGQVVPKTRVDGKAVLTWSESRGGEIFNGNVTSDMTLYAVEYAPIIEFDVNGGTEVKPVVARAGSTVALPTPTKELAKFSHWEDVNGNTYTATTMPQKSTTLKAVWQGKLMFDENGGSDVDDISVKAGESITLPVPEREGFIFAGWYTAEKDKYTSTTMPVAGVALKAGWYKAKKATKIYVSADKSNNDFNGDIKPKTQEIDMKQIDPDNDFSGNLNIKLDIHFKSKHFYETMGAEGYTNLKYGIYTENNRSTSTTLFERIIEHNNLDTYQQRELSADIQVKDGKFYIIYNYTSSSNYRCVYIKDYYIDFYYPDTKELYL